MFCQFSCFFLFLWWNLCTLYLLACQVRFTVGDSGLCCCVCVMSFWVFGWVQNTKLLTYLLFWVLINSLVTCVLILFFLCVYYFVLYNQCIVYDSFLSRTDYSILYTCILPCAQNMFGSYSVGLLLSATFVAFLNGHGLDVNIFHVFSITSRKHAHTHAHTHTHTYTHTHTHTLQMKSFLFCWGTGYEVWVGMLADCGY